MSTFKQFTFILGFLLILSSFVKKSSQTQCEFCKKNFKSLGRHVWGCSSRITVNRETSNANNDELRKQLTQSNSIVNNTKDQVNIDTRNYDYDHHGTEKERNSFMCYCGREFHSLRGLNTHRRSCYIGDIPDIRDLLIGELEESNKDYKENDLNEILPKNLLKKGIQLSKCDQEWERVNEVFRDTLSIEIDFNDLETAVNHLQETMYTVFSNKYGMTSTQESNENHNLSKTQLKKVLKELKSQKPPPADEINLVSKLLRKCYNKNKISNDNINHQKLYKRNFCNYCKTIFELKSDKVLPNLSEPDCLRTCFSKGKEK